MNTYKINKYFYKLGITEQGTIKYNFYLDKLKQHGGNTMDKKEMFEFVTMYMFLQFPKAIRTMIPVTKLPGIKSTCQNALNKYINTLNQINKKNIIRKLNISPFVDYIMEHKHKQELSKEQINTIHAWAEKQTHAQLLNLPPYVSTAKDMFKKLNSSPIIPLRPIHSNSEQQPPKQLIKKEEKHEKEEEGDE